jgi:hypothetical protein
MLKRSKKITDLMSRLETIKIELEDLKESKQEYYDERSEKWKEGEAADELETDIFAIKDIVSSLEEAYNNIDDLFEDI